MIFQTVRTSSSNRLVGLLNSYTKTTVHPNNT